MSTLQNVRSETIFDRLRCLDQTFKWPKLTLSRQWSIFATSWSEDQYYAENEIGIPLAHENYSMGIYNFFTGKQTMSSSSFSSHWRPRKEEKFLHKSKTLNDIFTLFLYRTLSFYVLVLIIPWKNKN